MARLIVKSPYLKCEGNRSVSGYLRYIGTRERVELLPDGRPPTRKQEQLIAKLVKDFPDTKKLTEYADYDSKSTKAAASAFISRALEENWSEVQQSNGYMKYIATRPRAERLGSHGLFGDEENVDLEEAAKELEHYTGNVWTHIISLKREDAERLGYDNARAWRNLLRAHRSDIAAAMNIPPGDFRWYAAFHNEGDHPHVHMMAWSVKPGQAYLSKDGIQQIKSKLTNDIFKQEMLHTYEQKSESRDELVREARRAIRQLTQEMAESICTDPEAEELMQTLSAQLETVKGKKSYGYLPKPIKKRVDEIVDQLEQFSVVDECYQKWWELQCQVDDFYSEQKRIRPRLSQQKEFRQIKNAVIQEAECIRLGEITFEDDEIEQNDEDALAEETHAPQTYLELKWAIQNESVSLEQRDKAVAALEKLAEGSDRYAQYLMGTLCRDGPLLTPDSVSARYWFLRSAEQGLPAAQYALGKLLLTNDQEIRDPEDGIRWLKRAAQNGHPHAAYRLGKLYLQGKEVPKNVPKAVIYLTQSAECGSQYAQYTLGKLYLDGQAVKQDAEQAHEWFQRSAAQGNRYAQFFLDRWAAVRPPSVMLSVTRLLHHMGNIFRDAAPTVPTAAGMHVDRKLRRRIREKKIAMGHKADDHEEQDRGGMTMEQQI